MWKVSLCYHRDQHLCSFSVAFLRSWLHGGSAMDLNLFFLNSLCVFVHAMYVTNNGVVFNINFTLPVFKSFKVKNKDSELLMNSPI